MNIFEFLEDQGIKFWRSGHKNVSRGWVGLQCPFCGDSSNHLGINTRYLKVKCWICGWHNLKETLQLICECSAEEADKYIELLGGAKDDSDGYPPLVNASSVRRVRLPRESTIRFPDIHKEYLRSRGLPVLKTIRKYKLRACWTTGEYKFRIIVPVYINSKIVTFTTRDITGQQDPKDKHLSIKRSITHCKNTLYGYDSLRPDEDGILVEGIVDKWKMGDNTVASFGAGLTVAQVKLLHKKRIKNLFVFYDNDASGNRQAKKVSNILAPLITGKLEIVVLEKKNDPGDLTMAEAREIKMELGFKAK